MPLGQVGDEGGLRNLRDFLHLPGPRPLATYLAENALNPNTRARSANNKMTADRDATASRRGGDSRKQRVLSTYLAPSSPACLAENALTLFAWQTVTQRQAGAGGDSRKQRALSTYLAPSSPACLAENALTLFAFAADPVRVDPVRVDPVRVEGRRSFRHARFTKSWCTKS